MWLHAGVLVRHPPVPIARLTKGSILRRRDSYILVVKMQIKAQTEPKFQQALKFGR